MPTTRAPHHDHSDKRLFSHRELVRDLLLAFVPGDWVQGFALDSLETVKGSFVTEDLRKREDDCLWRVRWGEGWLYVYILIEFQSGIDPYMAVRLANYLTLLYRDLIAQKALPPDGRLPPVLPIVLYKSYIRKKRPGIALPDIDDFQQVHAVLEQRVEQWNRQLVEKGRREGEARVLARLLAHRFGPLPDWAEQRLGAATEPDLDLWTDAVLSAHTLNEVFSPPPADPPPASH